MAPSESTPASISGASASTAPPAVRFTMSSTASNETLHAADADPVPRVPALLALGANAERKAGTSTVLLRKRLHLTGTMPSTGDDLCCTLPYSPLKTAIDAKDFASGKPTNFDFQIALPIGPSRFTVVTEANKEGTIKIGGLLLANSLDESEMQKKRENGTKKLLKVFNNIGARKMGGSCPLG